MTFLVGGGQRTRLGREWGSWMAAIAMGRRIIVELSVCNLDMRVWQRQERGREERNVRMGEGQGRPHT